MTKYKDCTCDINKEELLSSEDKHVEIEEVEFIKDDSGKLRYDLLPSFALNEVVKVLTFGSVKYSPNNYIKCTSLMRYAAATLRHFWSWMRGDNTDKESKLHPLAHCVCCLLFMLEILHTNPDADDRYNLKRDLDG
jgi:hypothetical protein